MTRDFLVINFHYIDGENTIGGVSFLFSFFFVPFVKSYLYMGRTKHELLVVLYYVRILLMSKLESTYLLSPEILLYLRGSLIPASQMFKCVYLKTKRCGIL